ncbi:MAG: flagellar biosynthesis protein FlhB [Syntrophobacteraceae bacterium]|nr:flagellar biosynthesis protein FlhB [Desulfobacteraceae bacterium]
MSEAQEKTEQPTGKKLGDARKRGQIPKSREMVSVCILFLGGYAAYLSGGLIYSHFKEMLEQYWKQGFTSTGDSVLAGVTLLGVVSHLFIMLAPTLLAVLVTAVAVSLIQTKGFLFSLEALHISLSNLNPIQGFKRFTSVRSLIELVKSILKLLVVAYVVYSVFDSERHILLTLPSRTVSDLLSICGSLSMKILVRVGGIMFAISLLDSYYQKWQHHKDLRMTKQEVKEENKQNEGNPEIKSRIKSIQRSLARQRMLSKIKKANVVVTNPTHFAVALLYKPGMEAPVVIGKGIDFLAFKIIKIARKHRVPVVQNPPLARALYKQVKLEGTIPGELYRAVAKVLAYVFQQQKQHTR